MAALFLLLRFIPSQKSFPYKERPPELFLVVFQEPTQPPASSSHLFHLERLPSSHPQALLSGSRGERQWLEVTHPIPNQSGAFPVAFSAMQG